MGFDRRWRPAGNDLPEIIVSVLHNREEHVLLIVGVATHFQNSDQVRMGQLPRQLPLRDLGLRVRCIHGDKLNRSPRAVDLRPVHGALFRPTKIVPQRKSPVNDAPLPLLPRCHNCVTLLLRHETKDYTPSTPHRHGWSPSSTVWIYLPVTATLQMNARPVNWAKQPFDLGRCNCQFGSFTFLIGKIASSMLLTEVIVEPSAQCR